MQKPSVKIEYLLSHIRIAGKKVKEALYQFSADILDRSAQPNKNSIWAPDIWATTLLIITNIASYVEAVDKVASRLLSSPNSILPVASIIFGLAWCVIVIKAKGKSSKGNIPSLGTVSLPQYRYSQPVRHFAKIGFLFLVLLMPKKAQALIDEIKPLPTTLYGYVLIAKSGEPAVDAKVRVVTSEGVDITKSALPVDSDGFYIIETTRPARRNSRIFISLPDCGEEQTLTIRREDEATIDALGHPISSGLWPVFRHVLSCGAKQ